MIIQPQPSTVKPRARARVIPFPRPVANPPQSQSALSAIAPLPITFVPSYQVCFAIAPAPSVAFTSRRIDIAITPIPAPNPSDPVQLNVTYDCPLCARSVSADVHPSNDTLAIQNLHSTIRNCKLQTLEPARCNFCGAVGFLRGPYILIMGSDPIALQPEQPEIPADR